MLNVALKMTHPSSTMVWKVRLQLLPLSWHLHGQVSYRTLGRAISLCNSSRVCFDIHWRNVLADQTLSTKTARLGVQGWLLQTKLTAAAHHPCRGSVVQALVFKARHSCRILGKRHISKGVNDGSSVEKWLS